MASKLKTIEEIKQEVDILFGGNTAYWLAAVEARAVIEHLELQEPGKVHLRGMLRNDVKQMMSDPSKVDEWLDCDG